MAVDYLDAPARTNLGTGFFRKLAGALDSINRATAAGRTCEGLANMSDAELASRGIHREDIPQIVIQQLLGHTPTQNGQ